MTVDGKHTNGEFLILYLNAFGFINVIIVRNSLFNKKYENKKKIFSTVYKLE